MSCCDDLEREVANLTDEVSAITMRAEKLETAIEKLIQIVKTVEGVDKEALLDLYMSI